MAVVGAGLLGVALGTAGPLDAGAGASSRPALPGSFCAASADSGASTDRRLDVASEWRLRPTTVKPAPITMAVAPATTVDRNRAADIDTDSVTSWVGAVETVDRVRGIGDRTLFGGRRPPHYGRRRSAPRRISGALKVRLSEI
jgi:hypothetical protein